MSVYETNRSVPLGSITTLRIVNLLERIVNSAVAWRNARATRATLNNLSDLQLADIGLERAEIFDLSDRLAHR